MESNPTEVALARSARITKKAMYMQAKALSLPENDSRKTELMKQAVEMSAGVQDWSYWPKKYQMNNIWCHPRSRS